MFDSCLCCHINEKSFLMFYNIFLWSTRPATPVIYWMQFLVFNILDFEFLVVSTCIGVCLFEESTDFPLIFNLGSYPLLSFRIGNGDQIAFDFWFVQSLKEEVDFWEWFVLLSELLTVSWFVLFWQEIFV